MDPDGNKIKTDNSNFLLRGCSLKNTKSILGLVAYTGHQTKIMLNSFKARGKRSKVEKIMGKQIIIIFIVQVIFRFVFKILALKCFFWFDQRQIECALFLLLYILFGLVH